MPSSSIFALLQLAAPRDGLSVAADVAVIVVAAAVLVLTLVLVAVFLNVNKAIRQTRTGIEQHMGPVSDRARVITQNVEFITEALKTDVQQLNTSVRAVSARLQQASDHMETRIEDFNALMEVVQGEAEHIFLDAAATAHGVREGARAISLIGSELDEHPESPEEGSREPSEEG